MPDVELEVRYKEDGQSLHETIAISHLKELRDAPGDMDDDFADNFRAIVDQTLERVRERYGGNANGVEVEMRLNTEGLIQQCTDIVRTSPWNLDESDFETISGEIRQSLSHKNGELPGYQIEEPSIMPNDEVKEKINQKVHFAKDIENAMEVAVKRINATLNKPSFRPKDGGGEMKQSKVNKASGGESASAKESAASNKAAGKQNTKPAKPEQKKEPAQKDQKAAQPDVLMQFQALEWHILTLAGAKMDEAAKKERLDAMLTKLNQLGTDLKKVSRKRFGLSPETVDMRAKLAADLSGQILASGKRFEMDKSVLDSKEAQNAMNKYEAREWQLLEQGLKTKDAAKGDNTKRQETEQENLFKSAEQYYGAAAGLAGQSGKLGIPQEIVQMRSEQRLSHLGHDQDLKNMRNPSPDAQVLTGGAAFVAYVKELIEKLAKAIKQMVASKPQEQAQIQADIQPASEPAPVRPN